MDYKIKNGKVETFGSEKDDPLKALYQAIRG